MEKCHVHGAVWLVMIRNNRLKHRSRSDISSHTGATELVNSSEMTSSQIIPNIQYIHNADVGTQPAYIIIHSSQQSATVFETCFFCATSSTESSGEIRTTSCYRLCLFLCCSSATLRCCSCCLTGYLCATVMLPFGLQ